MWAVVKGFLYPEKVDGRKGEISQINSSLKYSQLPHLKSSMFRHSWKDLFSAGSG